MGRGHDNEDNPQKCGCIQVVVDKEKANNLAILTGASLDHEILDLHETCVALSKHKHKSGATVSEFSAKMAKDMVASRMWGLVELVAQKLEDKLCHRAVKLFLKYAKQAEKVIIRGLMLVAAIVWAITEVLTRSLSSEMHELVRSFKQIGTSAA